MRGAAQDEQFERLVESHRPALIRLARRLSRHSEEAEDLLQESLLDAYRSFHRFDPDSRFYSWVARIMTNNHLDRVRRRRHPVLSLDQPPPELGVDSLDLPDERSDPATLLLKDALPAPFDSALGSLQPIHRRTVELCDLHGATYEEAAREQQCPVGTIRSRLHRAHRALQEFLGRVDPRREPSGPARPSSRRAFLAYGTAAAAGAALNQFGVSASERPPRVGLCGGGGVDAVAAALRATDVESSPVRAERLHQALAGLEVLVLVGAQPLPADTVDAISRRVRDGRLGLVLLAPEADAPLMAALAPEPGPAEPQIEGRLEVGLLAPRHPIAAGLDRFTVGPAPAGSAGLAARRPGMRIVEARSPETGEARPVGLVWNVQRGRLFALDLPVQPVLDRREGRRLLLNAVRWAAA